MIAFSDDRVRIPNRVKLEVFDGRKLVVRRYMRNSRVQTGGIAVANAQFAGTGISFKYIALTSTSSFAPNNTDTTLTGEITTLGLLRQAASVSIGTTQTPGLNGTVATTLTTSWTASGTITIYGAGLFSAASGGTLGYEATCTATPVASGYTVNASWVLNE